MGGKRKRERKAQSTNNNKSDDSGSGTTSVMWGSGGSSSSRRKSKGSTIGAAFGYKSGKSSVDTAAIDLMFDEIADEDDKSIATMEGICQLCEKHLEIDPMEDVRILVLVWKLGARNKPGQVAREEWADGCRKLDVDSMVKLKEHLPQLETGFLEQAEFRDFFKFCFHFNREGTHKTLPKELVVELIPMTLSGRVAPDRLQSFTEFLGQSSDTSYDKVTLDQWTSFLDFCVECEDFADYDEGNSAWPTMIDDYVEYVEHMQR